jgi:hypothetical protein
MWIVSWESGIFTLLVSIYVHLFFMRISLMHSLRKSLSETYISLLCNYYCFWHKGGWEGLNSWNFYEFLMDHKQCLAILYQKRVWKGHKLKFREIERDKFDTHNLIKIRLRYTQIHDCSLSWFGTGTSIKSGWVKAPFLMKWCGHASVFYKLIKCQPSYITSLL